ncbi:uncharacterized protein EMH_0092630 [Eimeria mitis]|uniref:Uncharacterized protein n=1 Tax=Eimeria mitis TaxID=44415 RepID=U6K9X2_9EIME|nr:uncharacterized protein EMH_0092630 [Eimeria mitis]CDJ34759.1 hypothetical protein, conserved [Eimeria mitis]
MVGELTLGSVALLQHGDIPGALQCLDSGSAAAVLQCSRLQSLAMQQRLATRKRMQKAAEGPQRAVLLAQRLTALAVSSLAAANCSNKQQQQQQQQQQQVSGSVALSTSAPELVEIVDAEAETSSVSCTYTSEAIAVDDVSSEKEAEACCAVDTPDEDKDIMDMLEKYNTLGVMSFASVSTILHSGDELRQALLQRAAEKQQKITGRSKGVRGGRNKGTSIDPQAKLDAILSILECNAS